MKKKILWITETAVLMALLVVLQAVTKPAGQIVTGTCVNCVLAVAAMLCGGWSGLVIALVSPWVAFFLGIGPQIVPIVPAISVGNAVFVLVLWAVMKKKKVKAWEQTAGVIAAAVCKALALYLIIVLLLCRILPLKPPQIEMFTAMFSWPQLVTAFLGGMAALVLSAPVRKALHK